MLQACVSKKAALSFNLAPDLPAVQADPSQVHQVLLNLVVNASEALGESEGLIVVSTDRGESAVTQRFRVRKSFPGRSLRGTSSAGPSLSRQELEP